MFASTRALSIRPTLLGAATISAVGLAVTLAGPATAAAPSDTSASPTVSATTTATLSPDAAKDLAFSREEERMARDLYAALAKAHSNATPMSRITTSEQQHFTAVGTMLQRYGTADPSTGRQAGSYADSQLQKLYDDWYARGKVSVQAAYEVGVELEKRDIADLKEMAAGDAPADVKAVYANLLRASERHLVAFENAVAGKTTGAGMGRGQGMGQAQRAQGQPGQPGQVCDGTPNGQGPMGAGRQARLGQSATS